MRPPVARLARLRGGPRVRRRRAASMQKKVRD